MFNFLKKVPLFSNLPDDDLNRLCDLVNEEIIPENEVLFTEGDLGFKAYVIMEGEVDILKMSGEQTVMLATRKAGEVIGEMSLLDQAPRFASGQTRTESKLISISHDNLSHLMDTSPSAARVMLSTITNRLRSTEIVLRQSEKMAQLGTLTAGIAHELNNPAAAARRGTDHLESAINDFLNTYQDFSSSEFSPEQSSAAIGYRELAQKQSTFPDDLDSLARSDQEHEIELWLTENNIDHGWELSPLLVNLGFLTPDLNKFKEIYPDRLLSPGIKWITSLYSIFSLLAEINQGTTRISEIVRSLKSYVYLDQAPKQLVNIHEGLDNTLVMMRSKLKPDIELTRRYTEDLPEIMAYGSELNQVWTNIIDNAVDAMDGKGNITIDTSRKEDWIIIDIEDSGPGIPEDVQQNLFSPFFTTKPMGKGTGLGLNISYNIILKHNGQIKVNSIPGRTVFSVQLPIDIDKGKQGSITLPGTDRVSDDTLLEILKTTGTIAVVGISNRENTFAYTVSKYLMEQGYKIIPINPKIEKTLGIVAHPDLGSLKHTPDLVLIFRRSEFVPEIVDQAIKAKVKVVWMQEGIINYKAAEMAESSGLKVVMDLCLRKTHQRLVGEV